MPDRLACVAILVGWSVATCSLFFRDILPDLLVGPPPDLRTVSLAETRPGEPQMTRWAIQVADDRDARNLRSVGQVVTSSERKPDGYFAFHSKASIDAGKLFRGTFLG